MRSISLPHRLFAAAGAAAFLTAALACGDSTRLPDAVFENAVDTVVLAALSGTPIAQPSGYDLIVASAVRTDRTNAFDFAFDIDGGATPRIYPAGTLGLGGEPGILRSEDAFADVGSAPLDGYVSDSTLAVSAGTVFVVRSRNSSAQCVLGSALPRYGKFHVLSVDQGARTITLELLVDLNCGYRGLEPGIPEN